MRAATGKELIIEELDLLDDEDEVRRTIPILIAKYRSLGFCLPSE